MDKRCRLPCCVCMYTICMSSGQTGYCLMHTDREQGAHCRSEIRCFLILISRNFVIGSRPSLWEMATTTRQNQPFGIHHFTLPQLLVNKEFDQTSKIKSAIKKKYSSFWSYVFFKGHPLDLSTQHQSADKILLLFWLTIVHNHIQSSLMKITKKNCLKQ